MAIVIMPFWPFVLVGVCAPCLGFAHPSLGCKHPTFKYHLDSLIDSAMVLDLEVSQQLIIYKKCLKEAAKRVRGECLFLDSQGAISAKLVLSSVSRALWFNNLTLAARLIRFPPIAEDLIFIDNGLVCAHSKQTLLRLLH